MVQIPQNLIDVYTAAASDMINQNFGVNCQLFYPGVKTKCVNCIFDTIGKKPANKYASGGPAPFNMGVCPICGGQGYIESEATDVIKLRVYYTPRNFVKIAGLVNVAEASAQVIGFRADEHKFRDANRIITEYDKPLAESRKFERIGDQVPFGLGPEKPFFICYLKKAG